MSTLSKSTNAAASCFLNKFESKEIVNIAKVTDSTSKMMLFEPSILANTISYLGNLTSSSSPKIQRNLSFDNLIPSFNLPLSMPPITPTTSSTFSSFIDASELKCKFLDYPNKVLVILLDCRTYTDFNLKHIKDSVHLNCRDKIIRKRLQTRKLTVKDLISNEEIKNKLDSNEDSLISNVRAGFNSIINRLSSCTNLATFENDHDSQISNLNINDDKENIFPNDKNQQSAMIVILDDKTSNLNDLQSDSNPLKIVQENIKQSGYKKECKILKGGFKEFAENFPEHCVNKIVDNRNFYCGQEDQHQSAIENATITEITPYLYLGNECDAKNVASLEKKGISAILNVTKNIPFYNHSVTSINKRISVNDCSTQNLKEHFDEAIDFIEQARLNNSKVLVHCQAGISRSPTIVIAYLMKKLQMSMNEAYAQVREKRSIIAPNLIFMSQLMDFEENNLLIKKNLNLKKSALVVEEEINNNSCSSYKLSLSAESSSPESTDANGFMVKFSNAKIANSQSNNEINIQKTVMVCN